MKDILTEAMAASGRRVERIGGAIARFDGPAEELTVAHVRRAVMLRPSVLGALLSTARERIHVAFEHPDSFHMSGPEEYQRLLEGDATTSTSAAAAATTTAPAPAQAPALAAKKSESGARIKSESPHGPQPPVSV